MLYLNKVCSGNLRLSATGKSIITPIEVNTDWNFGSFYNMYYRRFVRYAYYYVNDQLTAEDLTHDALLYYWENKDKLPAETDVLGYILVTVRNKCLNYLKHLQVEDSYKQKIAELHEWEINARIMTLEDTGYADIFIKDIMEILTNSLAKLPEQTRDIFIQNRLQNKPRREIATEMNVSLQKIDYHLSKANDHIYKDLKEYLPLFLIFFQNN